MKKILCILVTIVLLAITPITANANSSRIITIIPSLSFEDNTAYCSVVINGDLASDVIRAVVRLCYEGDSIKVWYVSGNGYLGLEKTYDISDYGNGTYEITVDFTINDETYPRASMEREYQGG